VWDGDAQTATLVMELMPMVAAVATDLFPDIWSNLLTRMQQRILGDLSLRK
jgi:hypothetical protein